MENEHTNLPDKKCHKIGSFRIKLIYLHLIIFYLFRFSVKHFLLFYIFKVLVSCKWNTQQIIPIHF